MNESLTVSETFRDEVLRREPGTGRRWLEALPRLCSQLCRQWRLEVTGPAVAGATALVLPVRSDDGAAALKLISPVADAADEGAALEAFGGRGAVRLLASDPQANALLLEWLPGPVLSTERDARAAIRTAAEIAAQLSQTPAPYGIRSLSSGALAWKQQLIAQHQRAIESGTAFPAELFARALEAIDELSRDPTGTLTHGDLSLSNIVGAGSRRWVAIDPLLLAGTAAYETHTVVRGLLVEILADGDPAGRMSALSREFADIAGVDLGASLRLSFARYLASTYWEAQNGGEAGNLQRLREATFISSGLI